VSRWFRFYADAMRNPKVMRLSDKEFRLWVKLLALASENDGHIPAISDLKLMLNTRLDHLSTGVERLIRGGLIDALDHGYEPHNWAKFQYKSDTSNERVAKHRAARNVTVTPPDTDTEADTEETTSVVSSAKPRKRGCRLPDDWTPAALPADCQPHDAGMIERELSRFRDYWIAKPGAQGVKLDWDATWRNWMRRSMENGNGNGHMARNGSPTTGQCRPSASLDWIERNIGGWGRSDEADAGAQGVHSRAGLALPGRP